MESLAFCTMAKKDEFIRIRADEDLKAALHEAAQRSDRKEADQARYLLRIALGLVDASAEVEQVQKRLNKLHGPTGQSIKGGTQKSKAG